MRKKLIAGGLAILGISFLVFLFGREGARQTMAGGIVSQDDVCESLLISLLTPTVQQQIDDYYKKYLTEPPGAGSASIEIEKITHSIFDGYDVELTVLPYYGPHNSVGKDWLLLHIEDNTVQVKEFRHLESYEIYGSYRDYIIEWPPE